MSEQESFGGFATDNEKKEFPILSRRALLQAAGVGLPAFGLPTASLLDTAFAIPASVRRETCETVDFRYSPTWWQTAICLPDDPDKMLVGKEGQLLFDYGVHLDQPGEPRAVKADEVNTADYALMLQPSYGGTSKWISQETISPRVPVVQTRREANGVEILEQTFLAAPTSDNQVRAPQLARVDFAGKMTYGCAEPIGECSPAFRNGACGDSLHFQLAVAPGQMATVVYGVCESLVKTARARLLVLKADGAKERVVDPFNDFGFNHPGVYRMAAQDDDNDGVINIYLDISKDSQEKHAVLSALWAFADGIPSDEDIIRGRADDRAIANFPSVLEPARRLVILLTLRNSKMAAAPCQPSLYIRSTGAVAFDAITRTISAGSGTRISGSAALVLRSDPTRGGFVAEMPAMVVPPGGSIDVAFTVDRHSKGALDHVSAEHARGLLTATQKWWQTSNLPFETILVPDRAIQGMIESCVRNIWQARELKIGGPAFQVGPTVYRGLWVVDGSFILESAAILGRGLEARRGIEYLLSQQKPDGSFEIIPHFWKENGIVLWAATRHAFLTQDKAWLREQWPALQRVVRVIEKMCDGVSKNPQAPNYGLMPGGFVDGGLDNRDLNRDVDEPEYSTVYWTLAGLKSFSAAAHWLGDPASAAASQRDYDGLYTAFRKACARDLLKDGNGNKYLPVMMDDAGHYSPQKGQWAFCHAVYPGQVFPEGDAMALGQLSMLRATKVEGMVCDTGWLPRGIWTYFASFYAHAMLWQRQPREAVDSLYAFAQHACPTRVWREEQATHDQKSEAGGDMPHNWGSAEFIRLVAHLIQLDRGDELHLLEGFPREWAQPDAVTRLEGVMTPFGALYLEVTVSGDGHSAELKLKQLTGQRPTRIVLHLKGLAGRDETLELPTDRDVSKSISLAFGPAKPART